MRNDRIRHFRGRHPSAYLHLGNIDYSIQPTLQELSLPSSESLGPLDCMRIAFQALSACQRLLSTANKLSLPKHLDSLDFRWSGGEVSMIALDNLYAKRIDSVLIGTLTLTGSPVELFDYLFIPPELIAIKKISLSKSYVWCVATIVHHLFTKRHTFSVANVPFLVLQKTVKGIYQKPEKSGLLGDFLQLCLKKTPAQRPNLQEAIAILKGGILSLQFQCRETIKKHLHGDPSELPLPTRLIATLRD